MASVTNSPAGGDDIFGLGGADRIDGRSGPILVVLPMIVHGIGMILTLYASPSFRSGLP